MATKKQTIKAKQVASRRVSQQSSVEAASVSPSPAKRGYQLKLSRRGIILTAIVVAILLLALLAFYYRSLFVVATVNGTPITRLAFYNEMESQYGKSTINSLVTKTLVSQEAKKQNISVDDKEIDAELKKQEDFYAKQGQKLEQLLDNQGWNRDYYKDRIKMQKMIEKLLEKDTKVTDDEIKQYIERSKDQFPEGTDTTTKEFKENIRQQLKQQKLDQNFQTWITDLQKKASIQYYK